LGRDRIEFFEAKLKVALDQKAELLGEIEVALRRNELALFYQPVVRSISRNRHRLRR
jgi:sensor c-di-GMP phosphodiesterase-like protein